MVMTVRALANEPGLGLRVRAGEAALDRRIAWVHPTELADPGPFLEGGELLLTTGLAIGGTGAADYVAHLVAAGAAGLGFGTGLSHPAIPPELVRAADGAGLPLLEVPRATPFIALTKAVSRAVAAEEYAALVRTGRGQKELTRTAVGSGPGAVARRLARLTGASVLLLDDAAAPAEAAPAAARGLAAGLAAEVARLRAGGTRLASDRRTVDGREVLLQALETRPRRWLAVLRDVARPFDSADVHLVNTAASLLSLALESHREQGATLRRLRTALLELLADGRPRPATDAMRTLWGGAPEPPWQLRVLAGAAAARRAALDALETEEADGGPEPVFFAPWTAERGADRGAARRGARTPVPVAVLTSADGPAAARVDALADRVPGLRIGVSDPVAGDAVAAGLRQADQAARAAAARGVPVLRFADHAGGGLLALLDPSAARAFADALLGPVRRHDAAGGRGDLTASLRCWLEHHGHWDAAAAALGVHRHTLRNRMRRVEELTGRSLASPGVRGELWFALHAAPQDDPG